MRRDRNRDRKFSKDSAECLLVKIAQHRDWNSFEKLVKRYQLSVLSLAQSITHNATSAEDAAQETFMRIWKYAGSFNPAKGSAVFWIHRIAARQSIGVSQKRDVETMSRTYDIHRSLDKATPETNPDGKERTLALRRLCGNLPDGERVTVALYFGGGLSQDEIAKQLKISQRAVSKRIQAAVGRLRTGLTNAGFAASLSVLNTGDLATALYTGATPPPEFVQQVLQSINDDALTVSRVKAPLVGPAQIVLGTFLVLIGCGILAWFWPAKRGSTSGNPRAIAVVENGSSPSNLPVPETLKPESESHLDRSWTFENGPGGLTLESGSWTWKKPAKGRLSRSGSMRLLGSERANLVLPQKAPKRAFMVQAFLFDLGTRKAHSTYNSVFWGRNFSEALEKYLDKTFVKGAGKFGDRNRFYDMLVIFKGRYVVTYIDRSLVQIVRIKKAYPADTVYLSLSGPVGVKSIRMRTLTARELAGDLNVPEVYFDREGQMKDLKSVPRLDPTLFK